MIISSIPDILWSWNFIIGKREKRGVEVAEVVEVVV
jgi:hypothetical protein